MRNGKWTAALAAAASLGLAHGAAAETCTTAGDPAARAVTSSEAARMAAQLGVTLSMLAEKNALPDGAKAGLGCERSRFATRRGSYTLRGENGSGYPRVAVPQSRQAPTFYLLQAPDLLKAMQATSPGAAPILGYALMTTAGGTQLVWRMYDLIPTDEVLQRDVADILSDKIRAAISVQGGQIRISPNALNGPSRSSE